MKFYDDYKIQSGWIHDYYCDTDGAELIFDIKNSCFFECPICKKKYTDIKRKRAWVTKYRYDIFNKIEIYSELYLKERNNEYLEYIINALEYYTKYYDKFPIHNKDGEIFDDYINKSNRCGRITSQGLNEAAMTIQFVNCISNLNNYLPEKLKYDVFNKLFVSIFELLKPQVNKIHNIQCYEICAIGMMGIVSNNREMIDFALNSEFSFYKQLELGTTKDDFWYEGSFHYHLYVLKPILQFLYIAKKYEYKILIKAYEKVKKMLIQAFICSFSDCSLPSPNDGWPNKSLNDYMINYEIGNFIFNGDFNDIIDMITQNRNMNSTIHLIDTGFSILKNEFWNLFIKYKDNNINHSHPDKLNIEIKVNNNFLTHDLSTSGYGSDINSSFYKKTYAHNTIVIDGIDQNLDCNSELIKYNDNEISVNVLNAYPNVSILRNTKIDNKKLYDELLIKTEENKKVDYFFHIDAKLLTSIKSVNIDRLKEYPYLKNIQKIQSNNNFIILEWELGNNKLISEIDITDKELYICKSPDNPKDKERTTIMICANCINNISFSSCWGIQ